MPMLLVINILAFVSKRPGTYCFVHIYKKQPHLGRFIITPGCGCFID